VQAFFCFFLCSIHSQTVYIKNNTPQKNETFSPRSVEAKFYVQGCPLITISSNFRSIGKMAKAKAPRGTGKQNGGSVPAPGTTPMHTENTSEIREIRKTASGPSPTLVPINLDEEIRRRAYELWEQHGRESGHENEHWLIAEREIMARYDSRRHHSA
jgi:hypothetical protein